MSMADALYWERLYREEEEEAKARRIVRAENECVRTAINEIYEGAAEDIGIERADSFLVATFRLRDEKMVALFRKDGVKYLGSLIPAF
jgi:hypothetical protein